MFLLPARLGDDVDGEVGVLQQKIGECLTVPAGTVAWVVAVVEKQLFPGGYVPMCLCARNHPMTWVVKEPLGAVVVEAVVHLVAEGGAVVAHIDQVARQVDPLPRAVVGVDEDLVTRRLPVLLLTRLVR